MSVIDQIRLAVAHIPPTTSLIATTRPIGVEVHAFYEEHMLARIYTVSDICNSLDAEVTDLLYHVFPQNLNHDYTWDASSGNFDLIGRVWVSRESWYAPDSIAPIKGVLPSHDPLEVLTHYLQRKISGINGTLFFTPIWSHALISANLFVTYEEFFEVMTVDFPLPTYLATPAGDIERAIAVLPPDCFPFSITEQSAMSPPTQEPDTLVLHHNFLNKNYSPWSTPDATAVAVIPIQLNHPVATIDSVSIEPDRFGRLRPVILTDIGQPDPLMIDLSCITELQKRDYVRGDLVEFRKIGNVPVLGAIVKRRSEIIGLNHADGLDDLNMLQMGSCTRCAKPLVSWKGELYCINTGCYERNMNRLLYANSPRVLDLQLPPGYIASIHHDLFSQVEEAPVAKLLTVAPEDLLSMGMDYVDVDRIIDVFRTRHAQLHGIGFSPEIQLIAQRRFLDALQLRGLYDYNLTILINALAQKRWWWHQLASVLSSPVQLRALGISAVDARDIAQSAAIERQELLELARL
jgi:hypothetical protein